MPLGASNGARRTDATDCAGFLIDPVSAMQQLDLASIWEKAVALFQQRRFGDAEALCAQLIQHAPDQPMAYTMLSRTCHAAGLTREATHNAYQAATRALNAPAAEILEIVHVLVDVGEHHLAYATLGLVDPEHPANADLRIELGRLYSTLEDQPRALRCLQLARANGFDTPSVAHMQGTVQGFIGPIDASVAALEEAVAGAPHYGHAHWSCAQFGRKEGAPERIARMREVLKAPDLSNDDLTYLHYGLFKELDTLGRTDEAWASLMAGAQARRGVTDHDPARETAAIDALIAATSGRFLDACGDVPRDVTPVFVVGMPRTGTTLLERILGNHPQIKTCGELNDFRQQMQWVNNQRLSLTLDPDIGKYVARLDPTLLGRRYLAKTEWVADGRAFYVDKHPMNFQWCGAILKALPHAKIIHLRRHPLDSCFSNLKELFAHKYYPYSYALDELATHYRNYARLMRHWHAIAPGRILDVRYEYLASQPDIEARRVQAYLGLPHVEGVTNILANKSVTTTASTLQLRQPIHTRNVGGWRRYATGMAPVQALLSDLVRAYEAETAEADELPLAAAGGA
ncbi:tetratricopeptide repeat-containing sulfotransferase family protein [Lysobacter niastensis]|uniref:Sulfotransferase n=1 Tax=Lysobacter niastensis TaxID=380629 RepID=A0ABS0B7L3_9GAMM|nr:sulfotransferase [Lysobacter niastensis]MBF6024228.1 sulfotransferase [Lysobacter niastensis]